MKATWNDEHFPHVLLENFFDENEVPYIMQELNESTKLLLPPEYTGTAEIQGRPAKANDGLFLDQKNPIATVAGRHLTGELLSQLDNNWFTMCWIRNNHRSWLLSRYSNGQYYNCHSDIAQWSMLLWMYDEPKPFKGGDLIFTDFKYTIECKRNTGIIFPGPIRHEVPPIQGEGRYTITLFTGIEAPEKK